MITMSFLKPILFSILTFFVPIQGLLLLLILAISLDTISSIYVSVKTRGWKSFRSALLRKGLSSKIFLYLGSVLLAYMADVYILNGTTFGIQHLLSKGLSAIWVYSEIKSLDENSMLLGNKSFFVISKEFFKKITGYSKDIKDIL
jgi:hypothetical protein